MSHVIEPAASGRAKCRGCGKPIGKDELRFGERQPNAFGDGEMTLWLHVRCAAFKRPEPLLETLAAGGGEALADAEELRAIAEFGVTHRRLPRVDGASQAPTSRARCRSCRETIDKGGWRIELVYFEGYRFQPSGYVHARCARDYFETIELVDRVVHFGAELSPADLESLRAELAAGTSP